MANCDYFNGCGVWCGVAGFLNVNSSPGTKPRVANHGLMDQIAALHWIKENVAQFGGDPENITMMGYEAGAACIHFLMSSPAVVPGEQLSISVEWKVLIFH